MNKFIINIIEIRKNASKILNHFDKLLDIIKEHGEKMQSNFKPHEFFKEIAILWKNRFQQIQKELESPEIKTIPDSLRDKILNNMITITGKVRKTSEAADNILKTPENYKEKWLKEFKSIIDNILEASIGLKVYNQLLNAKTLNKHDKITQLHSSIKELNNTIPEFNTIDYSLDQRAKTQYKDFSLTSENYIKLTNLVEKVMSNPTHDKQLLKDITHIQKTLDKSLKPIPSIKEKFQNILLRKDNVSMHR